MKIYYVISFEFYIHRVLCNSLMNTNFFTIAFTVKTIDKTAVEGRKISLPCPLSAPSRDKVYMVLWFKNDVKIPIYR